jgi:hypothetical protein
MEIVELRAAGGGNGGGFMCVGQIIRETNSILSLAPSSNKSITQ